jgi:hypothetical protein
MVASEKSPTSWVQLLQALVARELVEGLGVTTTRAAMMLGLAPSAISQYLSGRRVKGLFSEYASNAQASAIARKVAERLAEPLAGPESRTHILLEGAGALAEMAAAPRRATGPGPIPPAPSRAGPPRGTAKWLRQRVRAEQAAVTMCMRLAQRARDELTRAILRQIASDSLRHAEIVASLAPYLDRGITEAHAAGITRREIQTLIEGERRAEAGADTVYSRDLGGTMALLIASMEADERKHAELLQGLLDSGFPP